MLSITTPIAITFGMYDPELNPVDNSMLPRARYRTHRL